MACLDIPLEEQELTALQAIARRRQVPVRELLLGYIEYLVAGGEPITANRVTEPAGDELARLAQNGGAFDWLADEPDLYPPTSRE